MPATRKWRMYALFDRKAFSVLDVNKTGTIDIVEFLTLYKESENYQLLSEVQKKEAED